METCILTTTTDQRSEADRLAAALVEQRLAACVQITGPATSVYRWQGKVETAQEWIVAAKTTSQALPKAEELIRQIHSYDEPEVIVTPITGGSTGYLRWLVDEVDFESALGGEGS